MGDVAGELFGIKERAIDGKACDATADECGNLRGQVERIGVIETRTTVKVGANREDLAVDIFNQVVLTAQLAARAVVDAAIHDLQDAVLACHDARFTQNGDAAGGLCIWGDAFDFCKRELGRKPDGPGSMVFHSANAGEVVHGQAASNFGDSAGLLGER